MLEEEAEEATQRKLEKKEMLPGSNLLGTRKKWGCNREGASNDAGVGSRGGNGESKATMRRRA